MKKRELADDITDLRWRVEKLEAVSEQRKESRDAEIANMKTVHEVSAFWRMRAEDLQKKLQAPTPLTERLDDLTRQRDAFAKEAKELRAQLAPRPFSDPVKVLNAQLRARKRKKP